MLKLHVKGILSYSNKLKNRGTRALPIFYNHFKKLQTVLFEVEVIINNAPYPLHVCPNIIKTCLTPNHLLSGRQLLYYSNTTSTVVRNLTVLSSTTDKTNRISNYFWDRWRHEFVVKLRETQKKHQN